MATMTRRLRLEFNKVLMDNNYQIDDLKLEIDLVAAVRETAPEIFSSEGPKGAFEALRTHEEKAESIDSRYDVSHYPADVQNVIGHVCVLWSLLPPKKTKKGGEYARWIEDARSVIDACGDIEPKTVISTLRADFTARMNEDGSAPYTVSGPGSLVRMCRATAGLIREKEQTYANANTEYQSSFNF